MLSKILSMIGVDLIKSLIVSVTDAIKKYITQKAIEKQIKTEAKEKMESIKNETDAQTRAKRLRDMLNS